MALDTGIVDSVVNANFKMLAEQGAINSIAHQNRCNLIAESSLGQILNRMNSLDPTEAAAVSTVVRSDLAKAMSDLGAAVAGIQQLLKGAQTTIPVTG